MKNQKNIYITTAIPYANAAPHIGTAMDYLYADILLRHYLQNGKNVKLSIGTDEHGQKIEQKAADNNLTPQDFVDSIHADFVEMRKKINMNFGVDVTIDDIEKPLAEQDLLRNNILNVRTTDVDHVNRVQKIWQKLLNANVIYKGKYEGWYCTGHEQFFAENEAKEMDYFCNDHQKSLDKISEENYYLRVSKFTNEIREFAKNNIIPKWRGKEILELIKDGAQDVSISRPKEKLTWGIPVPGDETQVMYVWIDALSNYITALNIPDDNSLEHDFWSENSQIIEIIGKDITRFHAIIWPAMLLALDLKLPDTLLSHGFINVDGAKMSKSIGNVVSPLEIIDNYGSDAFKYYFSKHVTMFDDGDFTWEKFEKVYNGELANDLGNLVSRSANMLKKYNISRNTETQSADFFVKSNQKALMEYDANFAKFELNKSIENAWTLVQAANQFIDETQPWKVAKEENSEKELDFILNNLWSQILLISQKINPFLPETSQKISQIFQKNEGESITEKVEIMFPKKYLHSEEPVRK